MTSFELFWYFSGIGLMIFLLASGFGVCSYLMQLRPCKHEWEFTSNVYKKPSDEIPTWHKYRCIHCCKKKEV